MGEKNFMSTREEQRPAVHRECSGAHLGAVARLAKGGVVVDADTDVVRSAELRVQLVEVGLVAWKGERGKTDERFCSRGLDLGRGGREAHQARQACGCTGA